jgi:acyl-CoA synthetase (NDP forming)
VEECGKKGGVKAAVIISAGFKEIGEQGKILEDKTRLFNVNKPLPDSWTYNKA